MILFSAENIQEILKIKNTGNTFKSNVFPFNFYNKIKKDLQVHTEGVMYDKVISVYKNEDPKATEFVVNTYEPVTKASMQKGSDNISRIFKNFGVKTVGNEDSINYLNEINLSKYFQNNYLDVTISHDPNTFAVPYLEDEDDNLWRAEFVQSDQIISINDDYIIFIDDKKTKFDYKNENDKINTTIRKFSSYNISLSDNVTLERYKREFFGEIHYVLISKNQYISFSHEKNEIEYNIIDFDSKIKKPYVPTGVNKSKKIVFESPLQAFVPFGNIALLQHRTSRSVEHLFGYPRMGEIELPCDTCHLGKVPCEPCDEFPNGEMECNKCGGTSSLSLQSIFNIYKRKLSAETPELNVNIDPVQFYTPDIGILTHTSENWKKTIEMAEDAVYVPKNVQTGNVQSAQSRDKQLEQMYSWIDRNANAYCDAEETISNIILSIIGKEPITIEKPMSYAIMSEIESFEYLNLIVNSLSPSFIKSTHIENFLKKYVSISNPIIKIVEILKKVDKFCFYTTDDLEKLSNNGIIKDEDWVIHAYAYPIISQMFTLNPELLTQDSEYILKEVDKELAIYLPKNDILNGN